MDLKETNILGSDILNHWYYHSKANAVMNILKTYNFLKVLDVGAGSGFFSSQILKRTSAEEAWCVDISYDSESDVEEMGKKLFFRRSIQSIDADLVLFMDVLEHVDDDIGLLKKYIKRVPDGSLFLISVPAFQFLWSEHDVFLDHKRRYNLQELEKIVTSAGLKLKISNYYFGTVFPIAAATRLISKVKCKKINKPKSQLMKHHPMINATFKALCRLEISFMKYNRVGGLTVFCLAEK